MSVNSKEEDKKGTNKELERGKRQTVSIAQLSGELVEISEDAYKQNDVYRPWRGRVAPEARAAH